MTAISWRKISDLDICADCVCAHYVTDNVDRFDVEGACVANWPFTLFSPMSNGVAICPCHVKDENMP